MSFEDEFRLDPPAALRAAFDPGRLVRNVGDLRARARAQVPDAPPRETLRVSNAADTAVIRVYEEIWALGVNAAEVVAELDRITAPAIRVEINSPGGDMFDGIAIYNALRNHPAHVTTRVDGVAASAASVIAQAGDHRIMAAGSQQMIHNAWGATVGDQRDHAQMADLLERSDQQLAALYAARSGRTVAEFRELMNAETWLTGDEAVALGLADETAPDVSKATLNDRIAETRNLVADVMAQAGAQAELRARTGQSLTNRVIDNLAALRNDVVAQIDTLVADSGDVWTEADLVAMRRRHQP